MAALLLTVGTNALADTKITKTNPGKLAAVGPVNSVDGFPSWYGDSNGLRLEPCLDGDNPLCGFLPGDIPDDSQPISFPDNFPEEFFYQLVGSELDLPGGGRAVLTLGLEAAFANGPAEVGQQVVFARTRIVVKGAPANQTLTFTHPFGAATIDTDGTGAGRLVNDVSPAIGNFTLALGGNFGPFLKWTEGAPEGYVGNPDVAHAVTGSPFDTNYFAVTGGGLDLRTTDLTITGKIATNTGVTGDKAVVTETDRGTFLDVFATSKSTQLEVDKGDGYGRTPMTNDADSDRHYARISLDGARPSSVTVRNLSDKPVSTARIALADVTVTEASYDGAKLTVKASGPGTLTVEGIGKLDSDGSGQFTLAAPPASVSVKSSSGAPVSYPVSITGGEATPPGLDPVTPGDGGPVNDNTPDNPDLPLVAKIAEVSPALYGGTLTLDGTGSTNAKTYAWTQTGGPAAVITGGDTAKPTVKLPLYPVDPKTRTVPDSWRQPITFALTVTDARNQTSAPATVQIPLKRDTVTITAGARHRLGTELRIDGTSLIDGAASVLTPATKVVIWDTTPGNNRTEALGTPNVDTLGGWTLKLKPGPTGQVTSVSVQSSRGGSASGTVATR
ncbi:MAG: hypothetical protein ACJ72G_07510 [Friedmanniella sp.]